MTEIWKLPKIQRMHIIQSNLARLDTSETIEAPAVAARKERERKARLAEHDRLFGVTWGGTLGLPRHVSAGDERED